MKIPESVLSEFLKLGIDLGGKSMQAQPFNSKSVFVLIVHGVGTALSFVHLFCTANTFKEYTVSFYTASGMLTASSCYAVLMWKTKSLSKCLNNLEKTIDEREFGFGLAYMQIALWFILKLKFISGLSHPIPKQMYTQMNSTAELICKIFLVSTIKISFPIMWFAIFILSYFQYFALDLRSDAFILPATLW